MPSHPLTRACLIVVVSRESDAKVCDHMVYLELMIIVGNYTRYTFGACSNWGDESKTGIARSVNADNTHTPLL